MVIRTMLDSSGPDFRLSDTLNLIRWSPDGLD